ncbi:MAG TPA: ABC transporter permease [Candidatus Acidoferrales bacterium]|jgi:putative ABC transport system permease protein|nr:ABC transporter permease [Candidatus Acidoferrales bacterium]
MARVRFAFRSLVKAPLLSLVVILSVGLGIGANTAIFSLLHQILLDSLPVQRPDELVVLTAPGEFKGGRNSTDDSGGMDSIFSYPLFRELEKRPQGVTGVAAFRQLAANLSFQKQTVPGSIMVVSGGYFPVLGVRPLMGRTIEPADDTGTGNPVAVLGYGYWTDRLGGETSVLNQPIQVNGQVFTIVGVAPKKFTSTTLGEEPSVFVPLIFKPLLTPNWNGTDRWNDYYLYLFARLKPGVTRAQAAGALNSVYGGLLEEQSKKPGFSYGKRIQRFLSSQLTLKDGSHGLSSFRDDTRTPLTILICATAMVLLIAMANAANLLLARSAQRRREMAIRAAMGAGRGELMGQMLVEALLLALAGGIAGLAFAAVTLKLLLAELSSDSPVHFLTASLDWPVLLFGLGLSAVTGLLFGLYPAWEAARSSLATTLKDESGQSSGTVATARVRKLLVCAQVTVSAVLLIPTGLFLKSLVNLLHVDLGMRTENLIGFSVSPALNGYKAEQTRALFERIETEMAGIPGARSVAAAMVPLISGSNWGNDVQIEGSKATGSDSNSRFNELGPGFFGKMGIPLIAGREFTERDNLTAPKVAVVNQTFVKRFLERRNPVGTRFFRGNGSPPTEIVGVVKDSHYAGVKQDPPPMYYVPWRQDKELNGLEFYVRSGLPESRMVPQMRRVLASIDRDLPPENLRTMEQQINQNIQSDRIVLQLAATFAILATALAMLGLYGVMAHSVTRRTREIGIRMALGAGPRRIRGMVLRELAWILGIGLGTGVPAALVLARYTKSQLFGVEAFDAVVVAGAVVVLTATAVAAGYVPARRASKVSPLNALRYE